MLSLSVLSTTALCFNCLATTLDTDHPLFRFITTSKFHFLFAENNNTIPFSESQTSQIDSFNGLNVDFLKKF